MRVLQRALRDADDDFRGQAQQVRMQMEENHALGAELLHARELLGAERASAEQSKWRFEATQAATQAAARSQLAAALQLAGTAREDSARLRAELVMLQSEPRVPRSDCKSIVAAVLREELGPQVFAPVSADQFSTAVAGRLV